MCQVLSLAERVPVPEFELSRSSVLGEESVSRCAQAAEEFCLPKNKGVLAPKGQKRKGGFEDDSTSSVFQHQVHLLLNTSC